MKSLNGGQVSTAKKLSQRDVKDDVGAKVEAESAGYTSVEEDKEVMNDEIEDKQSAKKSIKSASIKS